MSYSHQDPIYVCDDWKALTKVFGEPRTRDEFSNGEPFDNISKVFGNPILDSFRDNIIVPVELPGIGPRKDKVVKISAHRKLKPLLTAAFEKIKTTNLPYVIHSVGSYYFRYKQNSSVMAAIGNRPEYAELRKEKDFWGWWNIRCAEWDRQHQTFEQIIPYGKKQVPKKRLLSNHSWGTAFDINPDTNPFKQGKPFDMPPKIVEIMASFGFHWGGYYHDYMHFEYLKASIAGIPDEDPPQVLFPFNQEKRRESPLKYYFLNEKGTGGYFPLGQQQNLHAGVHLEPDSTQPLVPVKAAMPGYIVAARLLTPGKGGDNDIVREATDGRHLGFVLIRHELATQDAQNRESVHPLYSLYMHLAPPDWSAPDKEFEKAPWLAAFLRMRHGAVVNLDPSTPADAGKTFWAEAALAPDAATYKVRDRADPLKGKQADGSSLALVKLCPQDVREAMEAFEAGSVVTFDRPLFPVEAGETIGFVSAGKPAPRRSGVGSATPPAGATTAAASEEGLPRYLHCEMFSTQDDASGLKVVLEKAKALRAQDAQAQEQELRRKDEKSGALKELLTHVAEHREDNFLDMPSALNRDVPNEIQEILGETGVKLVENLANVRYGDKLRQHLNSGRAFFPTGATPFTWPLTLTLNNPHKYAGEAGGACSLEVLYKKGDQRLRQEQVSLSPKDKSVVTVTLNVPAEADALAFWSEHLFLDPVQLGAEELRKQRNLSRATLFQGAAAQHWRNVVLNHVNEWSPSGLEGQLTARRAAGLLTPLMDDTTDASFEKLKNQLKPLAWWSRPRTREDLFGEVPVLGAAQEKSLFGSDGNLLPGDAKLVNMHPVTALWLVDLLLEQEAITLKKEWPPCTLKRDESTQQPPFMGLLYPGQKAHLGQELLAVLVQHGYGTTAGTDGTGVSFWVTAQGEGSSPEPRLLCRAPYTEGVAVRRIRFPFWGSWEVYATGADNQRFEPVTKGQTTLVLPRPQTTGQPFALGAPGSDLSGKLRPMATGTIVFSEHWPVALEGYVVFEYWKIAKGKKLVPEDPVTQGTLAIPVVAVRPASDRTAGGLKYKDDFIVGKEKEKSNPKVTANFTFQEFVGKPGQAPVFDGALAKFMLAVPLAQRLQELRDLCKPKDARSRDLSLKVKYLGPTGTRLRVGPSSGTAADLDLLMAKVVLLKENPLFSSERDDESVAVRITYNEPESTGPLHFAFDPGLALGRMAAEALSAPGETLHVRPRFIAPNGGHTLSEKLKAVHGEPDLYETTAEALKTLCGPDFIEVVADKCLPPVARFEFGDIVVKMGQGRLRTEVPLYGDAGKWKAAEPLFKLVGGNLPSQKKRVGNVLQADWVLLNKDKTPVEAVWGKKLKFTAEVSQPTKVSAPPPPVTTQEDIEVQPSLDALTREVKGKNLCFTGQGHYIPTDQDLRIVCEKPDATTGEWVEDRIVTSAIRYKTLVNEGYGRCTDVGVFEASVPLIALKKAAGPFRFLWKPRAKAGAPLKVLGVVVEPPAPLEVTVAELEVAP